MKKTHVLHAIATTMATIAALGGIILATMPADVRGLLFAGAAIVGIGLGCCAGMTAKEEDA